MLTEKKGKRKHLLGEREALTFHREDGFEARKAQYEEEKEKASAK